jgi:hypothetical protein
MAKKLAVTFFLVSLIVLASAVGEGPRKVSTKTTRKLKITSVYMVVAWIIKNILLTILHGCACIHFYMFPNRQTN